MFELLASSDCCNTATLILLEMSVSSEKRRLNNKLKPGPSLSSLLDVACLGSLHLALFQAKTALGGAKLK